jgi:thiol-disulfide isomerase/thioredoxin
MKRLRIQFLSMLLLAPMLALAGGETAWMADYQSALHLGTEKKRPVLLDFSAIWCGPCQMMARTTLKDTNVLQRLESFVKVKVDIDVSAPLAQQFEVHAVPTFVVVDGSGEELARTTGAMDADHFDQWLDSALASATQAASRMESFDKEKDAVTGELKNSDAATQGKAVAELMDYSFRKETYYRDFASNNLKTIAKANPVLFLDFLNNDRLAVRILAANLLHDCLGPEFDFDPWAGPSGRKPVIDKWRARLAQK